MVQPTSKEFLTAFIAGIVWGFACMYFAKKRGRNPTAWFILGLLFSVFALITLLLVPSKKKMEAVALAKAEALATEKAVQEQLSAPVVNTLALRKWYYLDSSNSQMGPIDLDTLKEQRSKGDISSTTYLWTEGMRDWTILDDLFYLKTELE